MAPECSEVPPGWERLSSSPPPPHTVSLLVPDVNSRSARVLFLLVVPGHLVFLYTISCMQGGHTTLTLIFIIFYMTAALLQVRAGGAWRGTCSEFSPGIPFMWRNVEMRLACTATRLPPTPAETHKT